MSVMNGSKGFVRSLIGAGCGIVLMASSVPAFSGKAHRHGVAEMEVAVAGSEVLVSLHVPLDSVLGYERAPRTAAERKAADAALARFNDVGQTLLVSSAGAGCVSESVEVTAPVLQPSGKAGASADGHAQLDAEYRFRCPAEAASLSVTLRLFDAFRRLERVEGQAALEKRQRKFVLTPSKPVLQLETGGKP